MSETETKEFASGSLEEIIHNLGNRANDSSVEWTERRAALIEFQQFLKTDSIKAYNFVELVLSHIVPSLSTQLEERRAQMCTEICTTITMTATALQERFEPLTGPLLTSLLKLTVVTIKIIAEAAHNCILSFVKYLDSGIPIVAQGTSDPHKTLRARCAEYIFKILEHQSPSIEANADAIVASIKKSLADADPAARSTARNSYAAIKKLWPERASTLFATLDPSTQKQLDAAEKKPVSALPKGASSMKALMMQARAKKTEESQAAESVAVPEPVKEVETPVVEEIVRAPKLKRTPIKAKKTEESEEAAEEVPQVKKTSMKRTPVKPAKEIETVEEEEVVKEAPKLMRTPVKKSAEVVEEEQIIKKAPKLQRTPVKKVEEEEEAQVIKKASKLARTPVKAKEVEEPKAIEKEVVVEAPKPKTPAKKSLQVYEEEEVISRAPKLARTPVKPVKETEEEEQQAEKKALKLKRTPVKKAAEIVEEAEEEKIVKKSKIARTPVKAKKDEVVENIETEVEEPVKKKNKKSTKKVVEEPVEEEEEQEEEVPKAKKSSKRSAKEAKIFEDVTNKAKEPTKKKSKTSKKTVESEGKENDSYASPVATKKVKRTNKWEYLLQYDSGNTPIAKRLRSTDTTIRRRPKSKRL